MAHIKRMLQFTQSFIEIFKQEDKFCSLLMTDKAHFHLNGFVNKQNFRYWGVENPRIVNEKKLHPQRVTMWCAITCDRIIDPYFFENTEGFQKQSMAQDIDTRSIHS